jgi:hypothetical protein
MYRAAISIDERITPVILVHQAAEVSQVRCSDTRWHVYLYYVRKEHSDSWLKHTSGRNLPNAGPPSPQGVRNTAGWQRGVKGPNFVPEGQITISRVTNFEPHRLHLGLNNTVADLVVYLRAIRRCDRQKYVRVMPFVGASIS